MACRSDPLSVEPHISAIHQRGRRSARAHDTHVPQPLVDALAVGHTMLLAFLKLRLQRGELGEGRIGIRLPATLLRIDPLTRLAAIPILEIAPAFAARTIGAVRAVAVRALAAAALALLRASFGALLTILPIAPRLAIMAFGLCLLGR